ncbi:MAG: proline--tRNA ligase [Myxococcales bacterium]|nr:proline--tRNA ligase [Myxococcales bacterium]
MRQTRFHAPTLKEDPKDAEVVSHRYLMRGGYIRKVAAGIYDLLPLATRVVRRIEGIIREELNRAGAQEVYLPAVQPAELWQESGRWAFYGPELLRFKDRKGAEFCLGPTHEEVIVDLVRRDVRSWRALPLNLYQIQIKFRDEIRPRAGLMRGREFIMKDAYSFDVSEAAALESYDLMYRAYERIFRRCGLDFRAVEADTGAIGGSRSHEFQVLATSGEDAIVSCDACAYAANVEQAELRRSEQPSEPDAQRPSDESTARVHTPGARTIDEVSALLKRPASSFIKTLIIEADGKLHAVLVRGDHALNDIKLKKLLGATEVHLADEARVQAATGAPVGFAGPVGRLDVASMLADHAVSGMVNAVVGANESDHHLVGVSEGRDFKVQGFHDLRLAADGDACPRCDGTLRSFSGIEVGHVFYLGTKYSQAMKCTFLDEAGEDRPMVMGCYGIGVTRIMAAAIEQNHDENGIVWPPGLAPFAVHVLPLQMNVPEVVEAAEQLYVALTEAGIDVLLDDRDERAGSKFKDADLLGIPWRIAIGARGIKDGNVELKPRRGGDAELVPLDQAVSMIQARLRAALSPA